MAGKQVALDELICVPPRVQEQCYLTVIASPTYMTALAVYLHSSARMG